MPHFHIPLQSGSDKILSAMRRRYKRDLYEERTEKINSIIPDVCIGVDVIVGFPGETDDDFLDTYNFLNELNISYLHVFTYSERENTDAAKMGEVVSAVVKELSCHDCARYICNDASVHSRDATGKTVGGRG